MAQAENDLTTARPALHVVPDPALDQPHRKVDRTAAKRQRRYRRRLKAAAAAVTPKQSSRVTPAVTASVTHSRAVTMAALASALGLAMISGGFSVVGLTAIFAGAFWPVIGMGIALEISKLSAVAWLGQRRDSPPLLRAVLIALVAVLMLLNAIGSYGFLARAHIEHMLTGDLTVAADAADTDGRISVQVGIVADLHRRIAQIDAAIDRATERGRSATAMKLADQERKVRADLAAERIKEGKVLAALQVERSAVNGERKKIEADSGPVRYLAAILNVDDGAATRGFILIVALLLDPAAVALLLAATHRRFNRVAQK